MSRGVVALVVALVVGLVVVSGARASTPQGWRDGVGSWVAARAGPGVWEFYLPTHVDRASECGQAIRTMAQTWITRNDSLWVTQMVDSWAKLPDGLATGHFQYEGNYGECVAARGPEHIHGKYCRVHIRKNGSSSKRSAIVRQLLDRPETRIISGVAGGLPEGQDMYYSTCVPNACTQQQVQSSLNITLNAEDTTVPDVWCYEENQEIDLEAHDIAFIVVVSIVWFVMLAAMVLDVFIQYTKNTHLAKGNLKFLLVFSPYTNLKKIFQINTNASPGTISCLNGMRVMSMFWVIWCHQQTVNLFMIVNWASLFWRTDSLAFQIIANGFPSVDTFFFMSGFLVAYNFMKEIKKTKRFNPVLFYVHRVIRLVPPILVIMGFYGTVARFFVKGPYAWMYQEYWYPNCRDNGWRDVLMVNNFDYGVSSCIGQAWYVSVDAQLYLVAPLLLLPLYYWRRIGEFGLFIATLVSIIIPAAITYDYKLPPNVILGLPGDLSGETFVKIYLVPWSRAGPWVVGMVLGYIMHSQINKKVKLNMWVVVIGWTVTTIVAVLIQFGLYNYNQVTPKAQYDNVTAVVYGGVHRSAWAACLAWLVYASHNGYGGVVNDILSHPAWQPLSRLTYTVYLTAMPFQYLLGYNAKSITEFTHVEHIVEAVSSSFIAAPIAILVTLMAESPVIGLEKLLLRRPVKSSSGAPKSETTEPMMEKAGGQDNPAFTVQVESKF